MATGDIGSVQASLEFEAGVGYEPDIFHIAGSVYAIIYFDATLKGWIKTVTISDDGLTLALTGSSLEYEAVRGVKGELLHVSGDIYAIFFQGEGDDAWVKTVSITDAGTIGGAVLGSLEIDAVLGAHPSPIHIDGNVFAVAYQGALEDGWIKTVTISNDGLTLALTGSSLEFDAGKCYNPTLLHRDGTVYVIIYNGPSITDTNDGWIKTVNIANDGTITDPVIASLNWTPEEPNHCVTPRAIHIGGDVFAVYAQNVYETLSVSADGATLAEIDRESGPVVTGQQGGFIPVSGDVYCACYEGPANAGYVATKEIPADGEMGAAGIASLNFNSPGEEPHIIHVAGNIYAIVARGTDSDGWLYTVDIETFIAPTVTTDPATAVAANSAQLNGTLDDDGGVACDCGFEWGLTAAYGNTTPTQSRTSGQVFSQPLAGLTLGTTYHFRAFATNAVGTSYGADRTFTTVIILPTVTTNPVTGRGMIIATFNGLLDDDGGEPCECGFEWGADITYGARTPTETKVTGETFSQRILGLFPGTEYHYRAFGTNSVGTSYGADESFRSEPSFSRAYALAREEL